tara:strand:- start:341 stop:613 length:273 start_codon:yes stop_codon:yes gene_type:complete
MIKKGDLVGVETGCGVDMLIITEVVKPERFYYSYSIYSKKHSLLVWDPACYFLVCPEVNTELSPNFENIKFNQSLIMALDKLFGFFDPDC